MPRYLGIDVGDQRTGLAISDEDGSFAFPRKVVSGGVEAAKEEIGLIMKEHAIEGIVIGLPQNFKGEDTRQTDKVRHFGEMLKEIITVPVIFQNEILTSKQIDKSGASTKNMQDASAAALILQQFLDTRRLSQ